MTTRGAVQGLLPIVPLSIVGGDGRIRRFRVGLDTGFNAFLSLPLRDVRELGLPAASESSIVTFANGESEECAVHNAVVIWEGERVSIPVFGLGDTPLVGMALLRGSRVSMDVAEGGAVVIEPL